MIRFAVFATPRSGSNWLCSLLDSHPDVLCHHELFNPDGIHLALSQRPDGLDFGDLATRDADPRSFLEAVWAAPQDAKALGFKINRDQSPIAHKALLQDPDIRKVVIQRANRVRSFVSEQIAERTGAWESYSHSKVPSKSGPIEVDVEALWAHVRRNQAHHDMIKDALKGPAFAISYEDLADPAALQRLLAFLEVSPDVPLVAGTRRQNPESLDGLIANYAALVEALAGSELAPDLEIPKTQTVVGGKV